MEKLLEFRIWGGMADSGVVNQLTADVFVQRVLYAVRTTAKTAARIAAELHAEQERVQDALVRLQQCFLVTHSLPDQTWEARIGVFSKEDIQAAQELAQEYAGVQAAILREAEPTVRDVFEGCSAARRHPWEEMVGVILGGLIADFCVIDRALFRTELRAPACLPPLQPDGTRWEYAGFELSDGKIYPALEWSFYHNQHKDSRGGFARWGCFEEDRATTLNQPELLLFSGDARAILTALCDGPLAEEEISKKAALPSDVVERQVEELGALRPPAVLRDGDLQHLNFPMLSEHDLDALLLVGDEAAARIHRSVTAPYEDERTQLSQKRGLRQILAGNVLVRDLALQSLIKDGVLPRPAAVASWNTGVWGWLGALPMWEEMAGPDAA